MGYWLGLADLFVLFWPDVVADSRRNVFLQLNSQASLPVLALHASHVFPLQRNKKEESIRRWHEAQMSGAPRNYSVEGGQAGGPAGRSVFDAARQKIRFVTCRLWRAYSRRCLGDVGRVN